MPRGGGMFHDRETHGRETHTQMPYQASRVQIAFQDRTAICCLGGLFKKDMSAAPTAPISPKLATPSKPVQRRAAEGYIVKYAYGRIPVGQARNGFRIGICGCCNSTDCGWRCCLAHAFCMPSLLLNAYDLVLKDKKNLVRGAIAQQTAEQAPDTIIGPAAFAVARFDQTNQRASIVDALFGGRGEGLGSTLFATTACPACATCQAVDAVMVYVYETSGQQAYFGNPCTGNACCFDLVNSRGQKIISPEYAGSVEELPLVVA